MKRKYLLSLFLPFFLYGENLNDLIDLSAKNKFINSNNYKIESLESEFNSIKKSYLPNLYFNSDFSTVNNETAGIPKSSITNSLKLNYSLYDGGKKELIYEKYDKNIENLNIELNKNKNDLSLIIVDFYYDYLTYTSKKETLLLKIEQLNSQYERLYNFLNSGKTTRDELEKINSKIQNTKIDLEEIELNIETILHNLEYITEKKVNIEKGSFLLEFDTKEKEEILEIKSLKKQVDIDYINSKIEKRNNYPVVSLNDTFNHYDNYYDNKNYDNNYINQNILTLNINWKIDLWNQNKLSYESKYKTYLSSKEKLDYEKNKSDVDFKLSLKSYEIAKRKIETAKIALNASNLTYEIIKNKYENGSVNNVTYLESLTDKYNSISLLKEAENNFEKVKARVVYFGGKNIKGYIK